MKFIILGAPCSGKTTLVNLLRAFQQSNVSLFEMNEEIRKMHHGEWPKDDGHESSENIYKAIASMKRVIFFTSYFPEERIQKVKHDGFSIIQLYCPLDVLLDRHKKRMTNDPTLQDESQGIIDNYSWQEGILSQDIVDFVVDTGGSLEKAVDDISCIVLESI